jgi:hypothetical protein
VRKYARKHEVVVDGDVQFVLAIAFGDVPAGLDNIIIPHGLLSDAAFPGTPLR